MHERLFLFYLYKTKINKYKENCQQISTHIYSGLPNTRTCPLIVFEKKNPPCVSLLDPVRLLFFKNAQILVNSILIFMHKSA